jgi:hypothetical protein
MIPADFHRCPGPCRDRVVPNSLYCCLDDWAALPERARRLISRTARLPILAADRRAAIELASRCWKLGLTSENTKVKPRV